MLRFLWPQALWGKLIVVAVVAVAVSVPVMHFTGEREEEGAIDLWQLEQLRRQFGEVRIVEARVGSLPITVRGSGHIHLPRKTELSFEAPRTSSEAYTVDEIYVVEGQVVRKGQVLAKLDTESLDRQLEKAKLQLDYAQMNLEKALKEYDKSKLVDAASRMRDSAFSATQAAERLLIVTLNPALSNPTLGRGWVENPQGQMVIPLPPESGWDIPPKDLRETIDRVSWLVQYISSYQGLLNGVFDEVDGMRHAMEDYEEVKEGPESIDVKQAQANVESAKLGLGEAEDKLAGATLKAPYDGIVEDIQDIEEGERISGNVSIITLIDPSVVELTIDVGEMDITKVRMGQQVKVFLDALPFVELEGMVKNVPLTSEETSGVVTYEVRSGVNPPPPFIIQLREGASALAEIVVGIEENVVWVPNMAVQPGGKVWVVRDDGMVQAKSVVIGKIAGDNTQIIAGLKGGESVVVV